MNDFMLRNMEKVCMSELSGFKCVLNDLLVNSVNFVLMGSSEEFKAAVVFIQVLRTESLLNTNNVMRWQTVCGLAWV